jgi:hypothetical protein
LLRGDLLLTSIESNFGGDADWDGFAITGEGEYLVWIRESRPFLVQLPGAAINGGFGPV